MDNKRDQASSTEERAASTKAHPGSERERDEQRDNAGPQYRGEGWQAADQDADEPEVTMTGHDAGELDDDLETDVKARPRAPDDK